MLRVTDVCWSTVLSDTQRTTCNTVLGNDRTQFYKVAYSVTNDRGVAVEVRNTSHAHIDKQGFATIVMSIASNNITHYSQLCLDSDEDNDAAYTCDSRVQQGLAPGDVLSRTTDTTCVFMPQDDVYGPTLLTFDHFNVTGATATVRVPLSGQCVREPVSPLILTSAFVVLCTLLVAAYGCRVWRRGRIQRSHETRV